MAGNQKKSIKNKIDKTITKIAKLTDGVPESVIAQFGGLKSYDLDAAKDVPALEEVLDVLNANLNVARRANDNYSS